jgi:hypothetical protein
MFELDELIQAARLATDDKGQPVVQIPLSIWEKWSGFGYDSPRDKLQVVISLASYGGHGVVLHQNRVFAINSWHLRRLGLNLSTKVKDYLRAEHDLLIGEATAEMVVLTIGSAIPIEEEHTRMVRGRNVVDGLPAELQLSSVEVRYVIAGEIDHLVRDLAFNIKSNYLPQDMRSMTPDLIVLSGDYGRLNGLDQRLQEATGVPVVVK